MEIENHPGCYTWNPNLSSNETVTWTGACSGGLASGPGEMTWSYTGSDGKPLSASDAGELRNGKRHGRWSVRHADGNVEEGPYVDGKKHGRWTWRFANGNVWEGPFVDGNLNGRWTVRFADGSVSEGPYVDNKRARPLDPARRRRERV